MKLGKRMDRINVKGGAIALGILWAVRVPESQALLLISCRRRMQFGLATMCIGLGQDFHCSRAFRLGAVKSGYRSWPCT